jgi:phosphoglycolate phosphatase
MQETVSALKKDYTLIVISSVKSFPITEYLRQYELFEYFSSIMGGDIHESKVVKINMVFDEHKIKPEDCVFITDTLGDIKEAAKCNVRSIGVTWGFHERAVLEKGKPFMVLEKVEELSGAVEAFFSAKKT